jgi:hypothetical protein
MARWRHRDDSQPPTRRRHRDDSQPTTRRRHRDDSQPTTRRRHREDLQPLTRVHGLSAAADAFFAVSLADSLFFNVSVEAARPRIFLYLVATMAPFAVLAPFIGPFIDRIRGGQRTVLVATCVGRAALTLALSKDLQSLLLFPEAFGVLVLGKAYSVGRSATVPRLVRDEAQLMPANAYMARISLIGSSLGGGIAVVVLTSSSSQLVLYLASILFLAAALAATAVSSPRQPPGQQTRIEYHELHAIRLSRAAQAMGLLRASVGLLTFMIVFALKRAGVPVWMFGVTVAAGGVGAMTSTLISSKLRERFTEERILVMALSLPAGVGLLGALQFAPVTAVLVSAAMGLAAAIGKQSFDAVVQHTAPDANLARAFAGFETRFQLFWISGAGGAGPAGPTSRAARSQPHPGRCGSHDRCGLERVRTLRGSTHSRGGGDTTRVGGDSRARPPDGGARRCRGPPQERLTPRRPDRHRRRPRSPPGFAATRLGSDDQGPSRPEGGRDRPTSRRRGHRNGDQRR